MVAPAATAVGEATPPAADRVAPAARSSCASRTPTPRRSCCSRRSSGGGPGGAPGENGSGGAGGEGGKGGSSYSWTETDTRTGSDGRRESVTTRHTNHGGSRGRRGRDGADGAARVSVGADGADGRVAIEVERDGVITTYAERYELRLRGFTHADASGDGVYEPGDRVVVSALAVENVGGMPTPGDSPLLLALTATDWLTPDDGTVCCPPRLPAGDRAVTAGTLTAAIRDYEPTGPGDPLAVTTTIVHRASLPAVRRDFTDYQDASARALGELVVRHPDRLVLSPPPARAGPRARRPGCASR
jgi:hypothetical protein